MRRPVACYRIILFRAPLLSHPNAWIATFFTCSTDAQYAEAFRSQLPSCLFTQIQASNINDNQSHVLQDGVLDTTEARIAEMLRGPQRKGVLHPAIMNKWEDEFPFVGFRPAIRKDTGPRKQRDIIAEVSQMYADYEQKNGTAHNSKPDEGMAPDPTATLDFKCRRSS